VKYPALALLSLVLNGCTAKRVEPLPDVEGPQRKLALAAMQELRQAFNNGSCQAIYDAAGDGFRRTESNPDWLAICAEIRSRWGRWDDFTATYWYQSGSQSVAVEGTAAFTKGPCTLQVIWSLGRDRLQMACLILGVGNDQIAVPPRPGRRFFDPQPHAATPV